MSFTIQNFVVLVAASLFSLNGFSKELKCAVDGKIGEERSRVEVPVTYLHGAELVETKVVSFAGLNFSVVYQLGDRYDRQASLNMRFGDFTSKIYDFSLEGHHGPVNVLESNEVRFQCWVAD